MNTSIISTVIISLFVLLMALGFLFGWIRGLNKSLVRFMMVLCVAVLSYFVIPPITKGILSLDISKFNIVIGSTPVTTLEDLISDLLRQIPFVEDILEASPTFETFIELVPQMISNVVLFVVFFFLFKWFSMIIYWIIAGVCFSKKKTAGKEKHKFIGAVIGALQGFIVAFIIFVPVFGILQTTGPFLDAYKQEVNKNSQIEQSFVVYADNSEEAKDENDKLTSTLEEVDKYASSAEKSWVFKMFKGIGLQKLSVAMFDGLTTIKVNKVKYSLRDETDTIAEAYPYFRDLTNGGIDIQKEGTLEDIQKIIDILYKSKVLSGMVGEVIPKASSTWLDPQGLDFCGVKRPTFSDKNIDDMFTALLNQLSYADSAQIKQDLNTGIKLLKLARDKGLLAEVSGDKDIMKVLEKEGNEMLIHDLIETALESETLKGVLPDIVKIGLNYVYDALKIDLDITFPEDASSINWEEEKVYLQNIFSGAFNLYHEIQGIEGDPIEKLDFAVVGTLVDNLRWSHLLGDSSWSIMDALLSSEDIVGTNAKFLATFKAKLESAWDSENSLAPMFGSIGDAIKIAKDLQASTEGGVDIDSLGNLLETLNESKDGGVVQDLIDELVSPDTLKDLGVDEDLAGVIGETLSGVIGGEYTEDHTIQDEIDAVKELYDVANKANSGANPDGKVTLEDEDIDGLVDSLSKADVLLESLTNSSSSGATNQYIQDNVDSSTLDSVQQKIEEKQASGEINEETAQKLKDLFSKKQG